MIDSSLSAFQLIKYNMEPDLQIIEIIISISTLLISLWIYRMQILNKENQKIQGVKTA